MSETTKRDMLEMIERMPDDVSVEDVMYALYVRQAVDRGMADVKAGRTVSHEEAMKQIDEWLQSAGR